MQNVTNGINYSTMREISLLRQLVNYEQFVRLLDIVEDEKKLLKTDLIPIIIGNANPSTEVMTVL